MTLGIRAYDASYPANQQSLRHASKVRSTLISWDVVMAQWRRVRLRIEPTGAENRTTEQALDVPGR